MSRDERRHGPRRADDLLALGFLLVVSLAVLWQVTIGDRAMLPTGLYHRMQPWRAHADELPRVDGPLNPILDAVQQFYPWRLYAARTVREGEVPLWTTQMLAGTPFVANGQSAVFYPETWLHYVIDPLKALGWATLAFYLIAGWGMYLFLRVLSARPVAAVIGALAFMFSGFFTGWLTFPALRSVAAWLPLALVGIELAVQRRRVAWLGLTSLAVGMQFLAGHLQVAIYVLTCLGLYALFRSAAVARNRSRAEGWRLGGAVAAAVVLGTLLAAAQLGPSLEMARLNYRVAGVSYEAQVAHALALPQALLMLMPDAFGNPVDGNHWGGDLNAWWGRAYRVYTETAWYIGIAPLLLGVAAVGLGRGAQRWFWLAIVLLGLALAFGTPLNALFRWLVPGYGQLTGIGRALALVCTGASVLAGLGAEVLMRTLRPDRAMKLVAAAALVLLLAGIAGGLAVWIFTGTLEAAEPSLQLGGYTLAQMARFGVLLIAAWALVSRGVRGEGRYTWHALALLVALDVGYFAGHFTPAGRTDFAQVEAGLLEPIEQAQGPQRIATLGPDFLNRIAPNTHMILGLQSCEGSESLIYAPYHRLISAAQSERFDFAQVDPRHPVLDLMAVGWLASMVEIDESGWRLQGRYETLMYANEEAAPRAFLARRAVGAADDDAIFRAITSEDADPMTIHLLGTADEAPTHEGEVRVAAYEANAVRVEGEMPSGGWLVLADVAYPGWRAYADGVEAPLIAADLVRRAVHLPDGAREVQFVYLPAAFRVGSFMSLLALGALGALIGVVLVGRRRG